MTRRTIQFTLHLGYYVVGSELFRPAGKKMETPLRKAPMGSRQMAARPPFTTHRAAARAVHLGQPSVSPGVDPLGRILAPGFIGDEALDPSADGLHQL